MFQSQKPPLVASRMQSEAIGVLAKSGLGGLALGDIARDADDANEITVARRGMETWS